jgi:hypothetical protein
VVTALAIKEKAHHKDGLLDLVAWGGIERSSPSPMNPGIPHPARFELLQ